MNSKKGHMDPIAKRTFSGLAVGAGIIALFLYCPLRGILPIVFVLSLLAQLEFYQMARKYEPVTWFGLLAGGCFVLAAGLYGFSPDLFGLVLSFIPALLLTFFSTPATRIPSARSPSRCWASSTCLSCCRSSS